MLCQYSSGATYIDYANKQGRFDRTDWNRSMSKSNNWCKIGSSWDLFVGDFNGDGRDDLLCRNLGDGRVLLDWADSRGRFAGTNWGSEAGFCASPGTLAIGDVNGDRRADALCYESTTGWLKMLLAKRTGLVPELEQ